MSQELKFRYYFKRPQTLTHKESILSFDFTLEQIENKDNLVNSLIASLREPNHPDYCILDRCQYTASHDKNGKEIYKGDIIEIELSPERAFTDGKPEIFRIEVCYSEYDASFHGVRTDNGCLYSIGFSGSAVIRREIIGNIYENPELINQGVQA